MFRSLIARPPRPRPGAVAPRVGGTESGWHPHFGAIGGLRLDTWLARYAAAPAPTRSLVLATDERTGSEWLCQMLGATGRLGRPSEYLNAPWMRRFIPDYPEDVAGQLAVARSAGTTGNGCFAIKLHPWHLDHLLAGSGGVTAFPAPVFVRLLRQDLLGQAISLYRARSSGRYHAHDAETRLVAFDAGAIEAMLRELAVNGMRWNAYFARNGITPLVVTYETLRADPLGVVRRIGAAMGESLSPRKLRLPPPAGIQSDATTEAWRLRFTDERRNLDRFDSARDLAA